MFSRNAKTLIALLALHALVDCFGGVWPIFKHLVNLPLESAGLIATVTTMIIWALQPAFGVLADKGYMRLMVVAGAALTFPMMLLGPIGHWVEPLGSWASYALMLFAVASARLGQAMYHPAGATISGSLHVGRRSTMLGVFIATGMVGYAFSQILFSNVYIGTGGHTELILIPGFIFLVGCTIWCRPQELNATTCGITRTVFDLSILRNSGIAVLFVILSLMSGLNQGLFFLLPEFLTYKGYPDWVVNGGGMVFIILGSALAMIPVGYLGDLLGQRRLFVWTMALSLIAYGAVVFMPRLPTAYFIALSLVVGALISVTNPLGVAIGQMLFPRNPSLVSGVLMGLAWAAGSVSQWLVGAIASAPGSTPETALAWLALANVAALLLSGLTPRPALEISPARA